MAQSAFSEGAFSVAPSTRRPTRSRVSALGFAGATVLVMLLSAGLAGWAPVGFSIATVFFFAGPHNWLEFRFFLSRMPARWGRLHCYFTLAIAGAVGLTWAFIVLPAAVLTLGLGREGFLTASALWNTGFLLWVAALAHLRAREREGRDWGWVWPAALALIAVVWAVPAAWEVALVYLHPLVALAFLQRELRRRRPEWLPAYYACLLLLPFLLGVLWWRLAGAPPLPGEDALSLRIAQHAGATVLTGVSSHLLVSTHAFLETVHYGVWMLAIPLVSFRTAPWNTASIPLEKKSEGWRWLVRGIVFGGAVVVLLLWGAFLADYGTTRSLYFALAMLHVLAEFPFFIRTL